MDEPGKLFISPKQEKLLKKLRAARLKYFSAGIIP